MGPVYIINPDSGIRDALQTLLESEDIPAQAFADANAFLDTVELPEGCVLAEAEMHGLNGLGLLRELRQAGSRVAVVILVGDDDPEFVQRALNAGAATVLVKPFSQDDLIAKLKPFLGGQSWPEPMSGRG